jgi:glucosylceramidase
LNVRWIQSTENSPWQTLRPKHAPAADHPADLRVGTDRHSVWDGFGGCFNELGWIALSRAKAKDREQLLRAFFSPDGALRLGIGRIPIGASDYAAEWYSHNESEGDFAMKHFSVARDKRYLLPYVQAARRLNPRMRFFASPWSPPTWMKFPRAHNYGTLVWTPENLRAYALYLARFVEAYAEEGVEIGQVHVQNEPVADQKFPSCLWTGEQLRVFIRDYLGPCLRKRTRGRTRVWLGTLNTDDYDQYVFRVLSDPVARGFVDGIGVQWAGKHLIQRAHTAFPEMPIMQTENECGDGKNTWDYAHYVFGLFQHYIANGATAYCYWNLVLEEGGVSTWGWRQNSLVTVAPATGKISYRPEFHVLRHFASEVPEGSVRRGVSGALAAHAVAWETPAGGLVTVVQNPLDTARTVTLELEGTRVSIELAPRSFHTLATSASGAAGPGMV